MVARLAAASLLLLLLVGAWLTLAAGPHPRSERVAFQNRLGDEIEGPLFYPSTPPPWTAVLTIHSIWQTEAMTSPLAEALAQNGFLVFDPPLDAHSNAAGREKTQLELQQEMARAADFLLRRKDVRQVYVLGHSMGADLACSIATDDPRLAGCVALGFPVAASAHRPKNLLMLVGTWDQLHPPEEMRHALHDATDGAGDQPFTRYGDRELDFLPLADHGLEIYDPDAVAAAVRWMGGTPKPGLPRRVLGLAAALLGGLGLVLAIGLPALERVRSRRAPIIAALVLVIPLGLIYRAWPAPAWHTAMLVIFAAACLLDAMLPGERTLRFWPGLRTTGRYLALVWGLWVIGYLLHRATAITTVKALGFFLWGPFLYIGVTALKVTHLLFHTEAHTTGIHPLLAALLVVELLAPGAMVTAFAWSIGHLVGFVQRLDLKLAGTVKPPQVALLAVLIVGAALAWHQNQAAGYSLEVGDMLRLGRIFLELLLIPALVGAWVLRSRFFRA